MTKLISVKREPDNNRCIRNHQKNAYCDFCTFSTPGLPCPREEEISYDEIKASEKDMVHLG